MNRFRLCLIILVILCAFLDFVKAVPTESASWSYSEKNYEIHEPQISADNSHVVFVRKLHSPDGHEAEMYSEQELKRYQERVKANDRIEDPEVVLLNIIDKAIKIIDFGWEPSFSYDKGKIAYAHQKKPISGYRVLAATLAGNEIREYDIAKKEIKTLVRPTMGYLSSPVFNKDDKKVFFSISDAVNGAWEGNVGIGEFDKETKVQKTIYKPYKENGLYHLVEKYGIQNKRCVVLRERPASKGIYMADSYYYELVDATNNTMIYSWGNHGLGEIEADFRICPSDKLEVYHNGWKSLSLPESTQSKTISVFGISSPDCDHIAIIKYQSISIQNSSNGESELFWSTKNGEIQSLTWSPDLSRVLLIVTHRAGEYEKFEFDELLILKLGKRNT